MALRKKEVVHVSSSDDGEIERKPSRKPSAPKKEAKHSSQNDKNDGSENEEAQMDGRSPAKEYESEYWRNMQRQQEMLRELGILVNADSKVSVLSF